MHGHRGGPGRGPGLGGPRGHRPPPHRHHHFHRHRHYRPRRPMGWGCFTLLLPLLLMGIGGVAALLMWLL